MITPTPLSDVQPRPRRVAVGEFDGVHLGHAEELVVIPFDRSFAAQSAQDFIDHVLVGRLNATHVSVGENFRFGHKAQGDTELLRRQPHFETRVAQLVEVEGEIVSSTHIRGLVVAGEVDHAMAFLGRPFELRGTVSHGDKRGRELGYPTANLIPDNAYICPGNGVYATLAGIPARGGGVEWVPSATNVGVRPMFVTGRGLLVEAYLLDWSGDLYDEEIRVRFLSRLRGEKRFASVDALVDQMGRDVETARDVAGRHAA